MTNDSMITDACISPCERYRYWLTRRWDLSLPVVTFLMLNPSTADARKDDATIRKCIGFAKAWGYGGIIVINLFALRSRNPEDLFTDHIKVSCVTYRAHSWIQLDADYVGPRYCRECGQECTEEDVAWNPIGPDYDAHLEDVLKNTTQLVAAWGCDAVFGKRKDGKTLADRPAQVLAKIRELAPHLPVMCLGTTKKGNPKHPLMQGYKTPLIPYHAPQPVEEGQV